MFVSGVHWSAGAHGTERSAPGSLPGRTVQRGGV